MSRVRADKLVDRAGTGAVELTQGATLPSGKTISGSGTIAVNSSGTAAGLSGSPDITVNNVTGVAATFTGAVTVGGVLTYDDVTNVDSIGVVTARSGLKVNAGGINVVGGGVTVTGVGTFFSGVSVLGAGITATGIGTFHEGVHLENLLAEEVKVTAGKLSDNTNINIEDGMVHLFTTAESTTSTPNIRYNGSTALNAKMSIGQSIVVTLITTANASAYSAQMTIDGGAQTERWIGGSAPSDGGSAGVDIHSFTIIKTADATFTVIGNHSKTS